MAVNTIRMIPLDNAANPFTVPGTNRTYSATTFVDVPDYDAVIMVTAGWSTSTGHPAVTTANRPKLPLPGTKVRDISVGAVVIYRGPKNGWVYFNNGAAA